MNHFFFSNQQSSARPATNSRRQVAAVLVVRKADGKQVFITKSKFHEALHEVAQAPEEAKRMLVTTPTGTTSVELCHEILERMPLDAIKDLDIAKYVPGGNVMDKRLLIRGILTILGHTESADKTWSVAEKEAALLAEHEAFVAAKKAAAEAIKDAAAEEAAVKALSERAEPAPKKAAAKKPAAKKTEPKKDEPTEG